MDTNEFLAQLLEGLTAAGMTPEQAEPKLNEMSEYLASLPEAQRGKELASLSANKDAILSNLLSDMSREAKMTEPTAEKEDNPAEEEDDVRVAQSADEAHGRRNATRRSAARTTADITRVSPPVAGDAGVQPAPRKPAPKPAEPEIDAAQTRPVKFSELDRVAVVDPKNQILFWVVFVLTLPLTLAVLLLILGVFAGIFLLFASVIALCVGALVGIAAAGSVVSLFGLVYGVTQLFTCPPAGLYEIGFAVKIAGAALFGGIILYNIAIRLVPWIMKLIYKLLAYIAKKITVLFRFIRRECTGK